MQCQIKLHFNKYQRGKLNYQEVALQTVSFNYYIPRISMFSKGMKNKKYPYLQMHVSLATVTQSFLLLYQRLTLETPHADIKFWQHMKKILLPHSITDKSTDAFTSSKRELVIMDQ